jgi:hypothetical protein
MMLFNAHILHKITSKTVKYKQFRLVISEKLNGWIDDDGKCKTRSSSS